MFMNLKNEAVGWLVAELGELKWKVGVSPD
jgi:hypothetical protein